MAAGCREKSFINIDMGYSEEGVVSLYHTSIFLKLSEF